MIVLFIAVLAVAALLLAGGIAIARPRARERQRRERLDSARLAAAAAARAEEERRRAAFEASDALTSVLPAIRLPWLTQPPRAGRPGDGRASPDGDYPQFPAAAPFPAADEPAWYRDENRPAYAAGRPAPPARPAGPAGSPPWPGEYPGSAPRPAEHGAPGDRPRSRAGQGSHRGGHAKRRRG
jgi:type II secretory pathway pseudopilin PulG